MALGKRKAPSKWKKSPAKRVKRKAAKSSVKKMINAALNRNIETKTSVFTSTDGVQILHNDFANLSNNLLKTTQGTGDPMATDTANRIGDKINLRGIELRLMLELNERYSDVTFRIMVIKGSRGDVPTRASLFNGVSGNKMLDTVNKERYTVLTDKWVKLTAPNRGTYGGEYGVVGSGAYNATDALAILSRATKIVKIWLPGSKFAKNGVITYDNGGENAKFFDYRVVCYAYSNYSGLQDLASYNIGRVNDFISIMHYKDA